MFQFHSKEWTQDHIFRPLAGVLRPWPMHLGHRNSDDFLHKVTLPPLIKLTIISSPKIVFRLIIHSPMQSAPTPVVLVFCSPHYPSCSSWQRAIYIQQNEAATLLHSLHGSVCLRCEQWSEKVSLPHIQWSFLAALNTCADPCLSCTHAYCTH